MYSPELKMNVQPDLTEKVPPRTFSNVTVDKSNDSIELAQQLTNEVSMLEVYLLIVICV
jgi:hypothetical protein